MAADGGIEPHHRPGQSRAYRLGIRKMVRMGGVEPPLPAPEADRLPQSFTLLEPTA